MNTSAFWTLIEKTHVVEPHHKVFKSDKKTVEQLKKDKLAWDIIKDLPMYDLSAKQKKNDEREERERAARDYERMESRCHELTKQLRKLSAKEIQDFDAHFQKVRSALDAPFYREAARIVRGDLDEDSFRSFQATIISMGEKFYHDFLADIQLVDGIRFKKVEFFAGVYANLARHLYYEKAKKWPEHKKSNPPSKTKITAKQQKQLDALAKGYLAGENDFVGRKKEKNSELKNQIAKLKAERLALVDPSDIKKAQASFNEAQNQIVAGKRVEALTSLTKAIQLNPVYAEAYKRRGDMHLANGDLAFAIEDFTRAIDINPFFAAAYESRAAGKEKKNDTNEALYDRAKYFVLSRELGAGASGDEALFNRLTIDTSKTFTAMDLKNYREQKLPLAYSFTILNEASAKALMVMAKERYDCKAKISASELPGCKYWIVDCSAEVKLEDSGYLFEWIYNMINLGREFGCVYGTWGFDMKKFNKLEPKIREVTLPAHIDEDDEEAVQAFMEQDFQAEMEEEQARGLPEGHILLTHQYWYAKAWFYQITGLSDMAANSLVFAMEGAGDGEDVKARALADKDFEKAWPIIEKLELKPEPDAVKSTDTDLLLDFDECRTKAVAALEEAGLEIFKHFSSVDCDEENGGILVMGIKTQQDVVKIAKILRKVFPEWRNEGSQQQDENEWIYGICAGGS